MSRFLDSVCTIISTFHQHAKEDGDYSSLSRQRMKQFIQREFADAMAKPRDPQTIDKILQFLEWDGDGEIDFNEFLILVFRVAKSCYWYLPKGPCLLQRTELRSSEKSLQEPEMKNRGRVTEGDSQTCESNHHPPCEPEVQRETGVNELETPEEAGSHHQQRNTRSRNDAKQRSEPEEPIPWAYEERSQEPCNQWKSQRRRQAPEQGRGEDVRACEGGSLQEDEPGMQAAERQNQERPQPEQLADVRSRSQTCEPQPLPNRWSSRQPQEPALRANDQKNQRPQEADRGSHNQPRKHELLRGEKNRYHVRELEQKEVERRSHQQNESECLDSTHPYQSYIEPLELELRNDDTCETERKTFDQVKKKDQKITSQESERDIDWDEKRDEQNVSERERWIDRQRDWEVEVYERRSRQTREREERGATTDPRETYERRECQRRDAKDNGRRQRESVRYERTRDMEVAAAEADVRIRRVTREQEPRDDVERRECARDCSDREEERRVCREGEREEPVWERRIDRQRDLEVEVYERHSRQTREREERGAKSDQRETCERRECQRRDAEDDGRGERESVRYERTQEMEIAAAEADVRICQVTREREPHDDVERRECARDCAEPQERRVCWEGEREEPVRERRIDHQRELDVEVYERRNRQTQEREERGATTDMRDTCERRECQRHDPEDDGRRQRESMRYERTRDKEVVAAEADVRIHRVTREQEPRDNVERRECARDCAEPQEERRVCREGEREESLRERRIDRQWDREVEVYERHSRQTREREERSDKRDQRQTCERRECRRRDPEDDGRRQRESVRYERTRESAVAAAEADVRIRRVTREREPRDDLERRECARDCAEQQEERRVCREGEREEPLRERRINHQRELDLEVYECRSRQTQEREERGATTDTRETCDRRECQRRDLEDDGRRQRESVRYERTRDMEVAAAEADVRIRRVTREREPRDDVERRECARDCAEPQEERRVCQEGEREEPVRERRIDRQRELDVEVYERRSHQTREREERGATTDTRETCDRRECQRRDPEDDGRRQRESVRYERTRDMEVAAAEADVRIRRVTREREPREDVERRESARNCVDREEERRVCREGEREEPVRERRIDRQRDREVEVYERHSRLTREREERGATTDTRETCKRRECQRHDPEDDGRGERESVRYERTREMEVAAAEADVRIRRVTREREPRDDLERRESARNCVDREEERRVCREGEREEPVRERRIDRQRDREVEVYERHSRLTREREERGATTDTRETCKRRECQRHDPEDDGRGERESEKYERTREMEVAAAEADVRIRRVTREWEPRDDLERRECARDCVDREEERRVCREGEREEPVRERRIDHQRELDVEVYERRSRQTREREERSDKRDQRQTCERHECRRPDPEDDGRRQRESVRYERTRESAVAAAEADVRISRVTREREPRDDVERREGARDCAEPQEERRVFREGEREEPVRERRIDRQRDREVEVYERHSRQTREREERGAESDQRETCERRECQRRDPEDDGRRQRESVRYERTRDMEVAAAEADVRIHRVTREREPHDDVERRDCARDCAEPQEERRICQEGEREEPVRERRTDRQRELDVEVYERRSRQTREREERGATTDTRETCDRRECQRRDLEDDGRRQRESVRYERTREMEVAAAEADVRIRRVTQERETRDDLERRECARDCAEPQEERRVCQEGEREEPLRERRIDRQQELDVEVYERRSRQTQEREERGATTDTGENCERRECQGRNPENDGRRQRESVRYERTREAAVAAAEADVRIRRVTREREPRDDVERRECARDCAEPQEERRVCQEGEREEPVRERRIDRQRELDVEVYERRSRQTREREERGATTDTRETCDRRECQRRDPEDDGRRQRESVWYERIRDMEVAAAEADVRIRRVTREREPRDNVERRESARNCVDRDEERRVGQEGENEEPVWERRIDRQRDREVEVYERRSRQTRERQERGATTDTRETCERRECQRRDPEDDRRGERESMRYERTREMEVAAAEADVRIRRVTREQEPRDDLESRECARDCVDREEERRVCREGEREEPVRERRIDHQRELDFKVYERRSCQTHGREEQGATADTRETYERRECQRRDLEDDGRRQRESMRYERTREMEVAAAEADVRIRRVTREQEPRDDLESRERARDCVDREEERRVCRVGEREEPVRERRIDRQRELDVEVYERRSRQTREREERGATKDPKDTCNRRECQRRDPEDDGRRQRESVRYERTREMEVAAAEADVRIRRVTREREPRDDVERRECARDCAEPQEERRVCREGEREEPLRERRIDRQRDREVEVYERHSRQTREREERPAKNDQRETCERRECQRRDPEDDGRRQRESVRYERTREAAVAAAEADVRIRRVTREREPRDDLKRKECARDCAEPEEERRVCWEGERKEHMRERMTDRQRVYERRSLHAQDRGEQVAMRSLRKSRDRNVLQIVEEEQEMDFLHHPQGNELQSDLCKSTPCASSEDQESGNHRLLHEENTCEPNSCRRPEDEGQRLERGLYRTVEVDNRDLCPQGEQASVTDVRVHYIPTEPDVPLEVQVVPQPCEPQTIAYLIHVIQNPNDPEATTYKIICQQPHNLGQPVYVKKCSVSPQPLADPCDKSNSPEPRCQRDERETGEPELPRQGATPGVKDGGHQASASEQDGVKGDACRAKLKEDRRDNQDPEMSNTEEKKHQPLGDGAKAAREQVVREPDSSCQVRYREDREAKSCPPLPQAPEPRAEPTRRDEARFCREDAELAPPEKSHQPPSRRSPRPVSDAQLQREEEARLCTTKQT
ncbi:trichohyalin-like [Athene cunicularia]|uniref:trichohyalin-like n=1 Tax=Athene cunicularia TaxID=194338 RepID=UPI000EF71F1A|nr:trichohyalin-like [Athene cunicularia]